MANSSSPQPKETRPEQYLREIRDLQKQNAEIMERLIHIEEKKRSAVRWKGIAQLAVALLPYAFSLFVAWTFYAKVQESIDSMTTFILELPESVGLGWSENIDSIKERGGQVWENKNTLWKDTKNSVTNFVQ